MDTAPSSPSGPTCGYEPSPWRPPTPASSQLVESGSAAWGRGSRRRLAAARFGMAEGSGRRGSGAAGKGRKGTSPECRWLGRARSKPRRGHVCLALPRSCVSGPAEVRFSRPPRRGHVFLALPLPTPRDPIQRNVSARARAGGTPARMPGHAPRQTRPGWTPGVEWAPLKSATTLLLANNRKRRTTW